MSCCSAPPDVSRADAATSSVSSPHSRTSASTGSRAADRKHALLALLAILYGPSSETMQIESALGSDPGLSYKLMRLINSAFFKPPRTINSLHDAIVILGRRRLAT